MARWVMKSEPDSYGWHDLVRDGGTEWDGVRNAAARLHLKAMAPGEEALLYHSGAQKALVGLMRIARAARPDGPDGAWVSVAVAPLRPLARPVPLAALKAEPSLANLALVRQPRLSVGPVSADEWQVIARLAGEL
jgi:predicted RNA-binding protein with PUA-like domain